MRLRDKIILGIAFIATPLAAADLSVSLYTEQKASKALNVDAQQALVLEEQLQGSVAIREIIQHPYKVQAYNVMQQEYDNLMAMPGVRQSIEESNSYTNAWYYDQGRQRADVFLIGGMLAALGAMGMACRQEKKAKESEAKVQESGQ